jgi:hypothetical protein
MKDDEQENEATIMPKMKSLSLVQTEGSDRWLPISRQPDWEPKFIRIDVVFKDQTDIIVHEDVGSHVAYEESDHNSRITHSKIT